MANPSHKKAQQRSTRAQSSQKSCVHSQTRGSPASISEQPLRSLVHSEDNEDELLGRKFNSEDENDAGVLHAEEVGDKEASCHHKEREKGISMNQLPVQLEEGV